MAKNVGFWNTANILSLSRIPLGILCAYFIIIEMNYSAIGVGILAVATDCLDGYFAKKRKMKTKIGGIIDPLTDKIFVLIVLVSLTGKLSIPLWKPFAILSREIVEALAGGAAFIFSYKPKIELKARFFGKIVTGLQFAALLAIILNFQYQNILIYILIISTVAALAQYGALIAKSKSKPL